MPNLGKLCPYESVRRRTRSNEICDCTDHEDSGIGEGVEGDEEPRRVTVFWPEENMYFNGEVRYSQPRKCLVVIYDDNDEEDLADLGKDVLRWLPRDDGTVDKGPVIEEIIVRGTRVATSWETDLGNRYYPGVVLARYGNGGDHLRDCTRLGAGTCQCHRYALVRNDDGTKLAWPVDELFHVR